VRSNSSAFLTWIDLTAADRDKVRQVLDSLRGQGTVDELGLGTLRDFLSDTLFPGTSVLHTRIRYVLFIPWIYRAMERDCKRITDVSAEARAREIDLIEALKAGDAGTGVIGSEAGHALSRLPSSVYWAALVRWGVFVPRRSQSWYHRHFQSLTRSEPVGRADDPGVKRVGEPTWHPRLPDAPMDLLDSVDFRLSRDEAQFLQHRLEANVSGSLLAWLAGEGNEGLNSDGAIWDEARVWQAPPAITEVLDLAQRFSLYMEGAPLLYNLLLAEMPRERLGVPSGTDRYQTEEYYRDCLAEWANRVEDTQLDPDALWALAARRGFAAKPCQKRFVEAWCTAIAQHGAQSVAESCELRELIKEREHKLKGNRARTVNHDRLESWRGNVGIGRMNFRWPQVRQMLIDLHQGLAN